MKFQPLRYGFRVNSLLVVKKTFHFPKDSPVSITDGRFEPLARLRM
jgi:hypothetical protein